MTLVLTNDDGIDAPGIRALRDAIGNRPSCIVAPDQHLSGCSHQINRGGPISIQKQGDQAFAIGGTPADCTRVAVSHLCPEVTWVLSGINAGGNMGADIYVSGTVAAVREAALMRVPGIALSQFMQRGRDIDWPRSTRLAASVVDSLMAEKLAPGCFWNVNLPHLGAEDPDPDMIFCSSCTQPLPTEFKVDKDQFHYIGEYSQRPRDSGSDVEVCFGGSIAVTKICLW